MPQAVALVVGAGLMGRWHAHAVRRTGGVVAGVVDPDPARATALAARLPRAVTFPSLEAALRSLRVDVVHVCTPPSTHAELVRIALGAGCHVLAEKPLTPAARETADLLAQASAAARLLVPVHQFGFQRGVLRLIERRALLGPIVHLEAACASAGAQGGAPDAADAIAADILPHLLGLTRRLLGVTLSSVRWSAARPHPGEWRITGDCGGSSVSFLVSMAARPTFAELRLLGERASARADLFHGYAVIERGRVSRASKVTRPLRLAAGTLVAAGTNLAQRLAQGEPAYPGLTELVRRMHRAAVDHEPGPIAPAETLDIAEARDRLMALAGAGPGG